MVKMDIRHYPYPRFKKQPGLTRYRLIPENPCRKRIRFPHINRIEANAGGILGCAVSDVRPDGRGGLLLTFSIGVSRHRKCSFAESVGKESQFVS